MKKILKLSLLVGIFMAILTIRSNAATVTYSDLKSDGSMDVTILCNGDIEDSVKNMFESAGYSVDVSEKKATKTYANISEGPKFQYFSFEDICVATPYQMKVGASRTIEAPSTITASTDSNVVEIQNSNKYVAKKAGTSTITINANHAEYPAEIYELKITVVDDSAQPDPVDSNYSASYDGNTFVTSGLPSGKNYAYYVDTNSSTPYDNTKTVYGLTEDNGKYVSAGTTNDLIQINQDLYAHIIDRTDPANNVKIADVKITKPTFNNYNYFSSLSHATKRSTQLLFEIPYKLNKEDMTRSIHYKIGRITDDSILRLFKNGDASGFAKLMEYAEKDSNPLYDQTQLPTYANGYHTSDEIIAGSKLSDNAFYYLYAELDDENGKYIPLKSVTLAQADVYPDQDYSWYLFFYGSKELNFDGVSDPTTPDNSGNKTPSKLPATGEKALVVGLIGITMVAAVILHKKVKKF